MDPVGDLALLASPRPADRFAAEDRIRAGGVDGVRALERLLAVEGVPDELRGRAREPHGSILHDGAVEAFRRALPDPTAPDLWAGAVAIATEGHPGLDPRDVERGLEALVADARAVVPDSADVAARVGKLTEWLSHEKGF